VTLQYQVKNNVLAYIIPWMSWISCTQFWKRKRKKKTQHNTTLNRINPSKNGSSNQTKM